MMASTVYLVGSKDPIASTSPFSRRITVVVFLVLIIADAVTSFATSRHTQPTPCFCRFGPSNSKSSNSKSSTSTTLRLSNRNKRAEEAQVKEDVRLQVLTFRRQMIRSTLKSAESLRNFRISKAMVPELDENGKPKRSDSKLAVTFSAFAVGAGAVALRLGGRAALVSAVGLDFANDNPELKDQLDAILTYAQSLNPVAEVFLFLAGWTAVKVFCFDAGGVVLALSSGLLFGGVLQGAVISAFAATVGSAVCFALAKLDTPVRKKALEVVEEYPSLRGIEKVVAEDGFKAIVTLRLAPILPIPLGLYNYVYGVTNVPFLDFCAGIFLGSLKPYLLDSYLGIFGKEIVDGSASSNVGAEDLLLLLAIGASVLIGVFSSQLAGETWDSVTAEVEAEKLAKANGEDEGEGEISREIFGIQLPQWLINFQMKLKVADKRVNALVDNELDAQVWNYTKEEGIPADVDPSLAVDSLEIAEAYIDYEYLASVCESITLAPILLTSFLKVADPLFDIEQDQLERSTRSKNDNTLEPAAQPMKPPENEMEKTIPGTIDVDPGSLIQRFGELKRQAEDRIKVLNEKLEGTGIE